MEEEKNVYLIANKLIRQSEERLDEHIWKIISQKPSWNNIQSEYQKYFIKIVENFLYVIM